MLRIFFLNIASSFFLSVLQMGCFKKISSFYVNSASDCREVCVKMLHSLQHWLTDSISTSEFLLPARLPIGGQRPVFPRGRRSHQELCLHQRYRPAPRGRAKLLGGRLWELAGKVCQAADGIVSTWPASLDHFTNHLRTKSVFLLGCSFQEGLKLKKKRNHKSHINAL